jgi:hypothetical protein
MKPGSDRRTIGRPDFELVALSQALGLNNGN